MTIASQLSYAQVPCNGTTTQFNFGNKIFQASDLVVTLIDTNGVQYPFTNSGSGNTFSNAASGLSYTVYNIDVDTGCYIIFTAAPTSGWTLDGRSNIPEVQTTSIKNQGPFNPELHEEFFDRATRMIQDLLRKAYTFSVHGQDIEATAWPTLPLPSARANTNLGFDGSGRLTVSAALAAATLSAASIGSFLYPVLAQESTSVVNIQAPYGWLTRYGASPANLDNATFIRNAYATGLPITIPPGIFLINSPLVPTTRGQNTQGYGTIQAGAAWTPGTQVPTVNNNNNSVNNSLLTLAGSQQSINAYVAPFLDGSFTQSGSGASTIGTCIADGLQIGNSTGGGTCALTGVLVQHFPNFGIGFTSSFSGDSNNQNCFVQQWSNGDQPWLNQANFTAAGVYFNRADCYTQGITPRWCGYPFRCGPAATTCWIRDTHPYNGTFGGITPQTDPVIIRIDEGASGIFVMSSYLDQGHIDLFSTDVHFIEGQPLQSNTAALFTKEAGQAAPNWIRVYATGKGFPYDLDVKLATTYLNANNNPNSLAPPYSTLPTSFIGWYPSAPLAVTSLVSAAGTATLQYVATSNFPPQVNSTVFLAGWAPSSFNNTINATSVANGNVCMILTVGTTDYTTIGADVNAVGHIFLASGAATGTGTVALGYNVAGSSQTAGGPGVGVVTITFACAVTATGTGGTVQRSFSGNMNGFTSAGGLLQNGAHQQAHLAGGRYFCATGNGTNPADVLHYQANFINSVIQCGNQAPSFWGYGNQPGGEPFATFTSGFFTVRAAPAAINYVPPNPGRANLGLNLTGTAMWDDGSTNGMFQIATQGGARINVDGFSGGAKAMYSATDQYMSLGNGTFRYSAVFAVTGVVNTSDAREKDQVSAPVPGSSYLKRLKVFPYKWKVGGRHIEHGKFIDASGDEVKDYSPAANMAAQDLLRAKLGSYPGARRGKVEKDGSISWQGRSEEQEIAFQAEEAQLQTLVKQYLSIRRTEDVVTDLPGVRTHYGVSAQNVKEALDAEGILDHAGWTLEDPSKPDSRQGVRIDQAILMPTVVTVQEHIEKIAALEDLVAKLIAKVGPV